MFWLGIVLLLILSRVDATELSDIPKQDSLHALFADVAAKPEQYLPHYTTTPPQANLVTEEAKLVEVDNLDKHESAKMVSGAYQDQAEQIKALPTSKEVEDIDGLQESLNAKYADCQKTVHCAIPEVSSGGDFKQVASHVAVISEATSVLPGNLNEHAPTIFQGQAYQCRKYGFGFLDCCKDSGWGQFLSECNQEEIALRKARENKTAIYLGTKKTGSSLRRRKYEVYCVFDTHLAKIIQEQGRSWQLALGFGRPDSPQCRGISPSELARINFDRIDFSAIYSSIVSDRNNNFNELTQPVIARIQEKVDEGK